MSSLERWSCCEVTGDKVIDWSFTKHLFYSRVPTLVWKTDRWKIITQIARVIKRRCRGWGEYRKVSRYWNVEKIGFRMVTDTLTVKLTYGMTQEKGIPFTLWALVFTSLIRVGQTRSVVPSWGNFYPQEDNSQCLETISLLWLGQRSVIGI